MPDEEKPRPSEPQPDEPRVLRPTVLRPPSRGDAAPAGPTAPRRSSTRQPTVIDPKAGSGRAPARPSGIDGTGPAAAPAHASDAEASGPAATPVAAPTAIIGTERKRIEVSLDDLKDLSPGSEPDVLAQAIRLLQAYVPDDASDRTVILWGQQLQQDYADMVSAALARAQADVLTRVTVHLNRMMDILKSIDVAAVAGTERTGGGLGKVLKRMSKKIDTAEELAAARVELDQLVKLMSAEMGRLLDLKGEMEQSSRRIDELRAEVEASALAAQFLSSYLQKTDEGLSRRFLERSMSLTQTALQIGGSASLRESEVEQPLRLISAIQNVALVMVPGWLGTIGSLTTLAGREATPTEAGEMAFQLRKILEQLES